MIEFMLLSGPRCGTTWAANWLTTDTTLCIHDPLYEHHYTTLDDMESDKVLGVSCTGLFNFPEWVNKHPARKIILRRPQGEISASLEAIGLPDIQCEKKLEAINGTHVYWLELFNNPIHIYETLLQQPFDVERHELLKSIHMQPTFEDITVNKQVTQKLVDEVRRAL